MDALVYKYQFKPHISFDDLRALLDLSMFGVTSIYGETQVRLDARYSFDEAARSFVIDASSPVGSALNFLFIGYARGQFTDEAFTVRRAERTPEPQTARVAS